MSRHSDVLRERIQFHTGHDLDPGDLEDILRALDALTDPEQQFDPGAPAEPGEGQGLGLEAFGRFLSTSAAPQPSAAPQVPEFWVVNDKREGTAIWWWDRTKISMLVHQHDVVYGSTPDVVVQGRRDARTRLWDHITRDIPTAPPCQFADGCHDVAITHPNLCPTHKPEDT